MLYGSMIATCRFILRDFEAADRPGFCAYHADPRYRAMFASAEAESGEPEQLLARFAAWVAERPRCNYQLAVVRRGDSETLVGCCGLRRASATSAVAELGIELAPDYWGRFAYAIEISRALMEFGFNELHLSEIVGATQSVNTRVRRLAEWFGAAVIANRPGPEWMRSLGWTEIEWRIDRASWKRNEAARRFE